MSAKTKKSQKVKKVKKVKMCLSLIRREGYFFLVFQPNQQSFAVRKEAARGSLRASMRHANLSSVCGGFESLFTPARMEPRSSTPRAWWAPNLFSGASTTATCAEPAREATSKPFQLLYGSLGFTSSNLHWFGCEAYRTLRGTPQPLFQTKKRSQQHGKNTISTNT